jgi:hypothetical protein
MDWVACAMQQQGGCAVCGWSVLRGYERIQKWELTSLECRSSKETAVWPEEELEDLVCDVTCAIVILRV